MVSLGTLLTEAVQTDGSLEFEVPDDWLQGRTAYGGLTMAAAYRAAAATDPALPPLRSAQIAFAGPAAGRVQVRATILRRGRSSGFVEASVLSGGETAAVAIFLFLAERESELALAAPPAGDVPPPELAEPAMRRAMPGFASQFEYRHGLAKSGRPLPELLRWVRLRERTGLDPVTELLAIGDALPSGAAPLLARPAPISTANWTANLLNPHAATQDGWWLARSKAEFAAAGNSSQSMTVWSSSGEGVMHGMQQVSIYG